MLPRVLIHIAVSADGHTVGFPVNIGTYYSLAMGFSADAHLTGSQTIIAAEEQNPDIEGEAAASPAPTAANDTRPLLVIPDSRGRVQNWQVLRKAPFWRDMIALCSTSTPADHIDYLRELKIETIVGGDDHVDLRHALEQLHDRYDVQVVHVDSGGTLNGVMLRAGLVDEVSLLVHPCLVGGMTPKTLLSAPDLASPEGVIRLKLVHLEQLADQLVWIRYEVIR